MSHFTVLVIGDNVEKALQPFHEYECTGIEDEHVKFVEATENLEEEYEKHKEDYDSLEQFVEDYYGYEKRDDKWGRMTNPNAKWDWWVIGGRWSGSYFKVKHGAQGIAEGQPGVFGNETGIDVIRVGDIDWEAMRGEAEERAKKYFEKLEAAFGGSIPQPEVAWSEMHTKEEYKDWEIQTKRDFYHAQPALQKLAEVQKLDTEHELFGFFFSLEDFACGKDEYVRRKGEDALTTYAVVKNGKWYQKGEMGWFGMASNEKDAEQWGDEMSALLADVDEDEIATLVDCHI